MPVNKSIESLKPAMQAIVRTFLERLKTENIPVAIVETLRTQEVQDCYYMQGREPLEKVNAARKSAGLYLLTEEENKRTVTNTRNSRHLLGIAIDVCPLDTQGRYWWNAPQAIWEKIGLMGEECGLDWCAGGAGAIWGKGWDNPHFEYKE